MSEMHRGGNGFYGNQAFAGGMGQNPDLNHNNFYGNFTSGGISQQFDRDSGAPSYGNSFIDNAQGLGLYGNSSHGRTHGNFMMNNPMWSQFEKIRNEFQLKNSQYVEQKQQQKTGPQLNRPSSFSFNPDSVRCTGGRNSFQQDPMPPTASKAPSDGKYGFGEDLSTPSLNHDLQDLWTAQKFGGGHGFCWSHDAMRSPLDFAQLGPAFSALNVSEH